jgi:hypothetical protein
MPTQKNNMEEHPLVSILAPDPAKVPKLRVLKGWPGRSTVRGSWRIYTSEALDEYVQVRNVDIVYHRPAAEDEPATIWIRQGAQVKTVAPERRPAGDYLVGEIVDLLRGQTGGGGGWSDPEPTKCPPCRSR